MREDPGGLILGSVLPGLDVAAVRAYCEQIVPPHALHEVRVETIVTRGAVTIVERPVMRNKQPVMKDGAPMFQFFLRGESEPNDVVNLDA